MFYCQIKFLMIQKVNYIKLITHVRDSSTLLCSSPFFTSLHIIEKDSYGFLISIRYMINSTWKILVPNNINYNYSTIRFACRNGPLRYKHALDFHNINQPTKDKHLSAKINLTDALDMKTPILFLNLFCRKIKKRE